MPFFENICEEGPKHKFDVNSNLIKRARNHNQNDFLFSFVLEFNKIIPSSCLSEVLLNTLNYYYFEKSYEVL